MTTSRILVICALLAACASLNGAVVELKNGDRITGRILSKDKYYVHLKSDLLGRMDIPRSRIVKIQEDKLTGSDDKTNPLPPVANISGNSLATAPITNDKPAKKASETAKHGTDATPPPPAGAPASANPSNTAETVPVPVEKKDLKGRKYISHLMVNFLRRINYLDKWKSNLRIGYSLYSGETDSFSSTINFLTERIWTKDAFRLEFLQDYATSTSSSGEETVSRDKLKITGRYRHSINHSRMFFQSESQYGYAHVSGIDQDYLQSVGYGWRLLQNEVWYFCLVPSMAGQYQVIEGNAERAVSPTLYEEAEYKWTDTLLIHSEAYAIVPVTGDNDPTYHFSFMLKNKLVGNLSLNIEYVFDFDGSVEADKDAASQSLRTSFGIDF